MIITAKKVSKTGAIIFIIILGALVTLAVLLMGSGSTSRQFQNIKTNEDRVNFLKSYGWEVELEPISEREVQIPSQFDDVYIKYNDMQKKQGLDLEKYRGKQVMHYGYLVKNYPSGDSNVIANILVYKNTVIAGDITSPRLDGFIQGLEMPNNKS